MTDRRRISAPVIVIAVIGALIVILAGAYCGVCKWVQGNGRLLPGTVANNTVGDPQLDLGKMDIEEARGLLADYMEEDLRGRRITINFLKNQSATLAGEFLKGDTEASIAYGMDRKKETPFLRLGAIWFGLSQQPVELSLSAAELTEEGVKELDRIVAEIAERMLETPVEVSWELDQKEQLLTVTPGVAGRGLDEETLRADVHTALIGGKEHVEAQYVEIPPQELTGEILCELAVREPADPVLQEDGKLSLPTVGIVFDAATAQEALDKAEPGQPFSFPVECPMPDFSTCQDLLYQDVLAENISYMDGVYSRSFNVNRTAEFCNNTILMPGEVFSYLGRIGDPSVKNGYMLSTGYQGGKTVEMEGGGACQVSSALYYCTFYANLEVVNRAAHAFVVGYMPKGLDATVYYPSLDYKFRNNTPYPIKIVAYTSNRVYGRVTVRILGTKVDDSYVKAEVHQLSSTPWETVYKPDASIPLGTTKEDVTPYTGYKVEVYRCVYAGDGTLISRTFENISAYAKRDRVYLFNPADAASLGLDANGKPIPGGVPTPSPSPEPTPTPTPTPEPSPTPEPTPEPTPTPTPTPEPSPDPGPDAPTPPEGEPPASSGEGE